MTATTEFTVDATIARRERARRYLKQYGPVQCWLMKLEQKYDNLDSQRFRWNQRYDSCGGGSSEKRDLADIVAGFDMLLQDATRRMERLRGFQEEIEATVAYVQVVNPSAASALREKYFVIGQSPDWKDIAPELRYAESTVKLHHVQGLDLVADILEERNYDKELYPFLTAKP
ncbi:MAG: hypothetical protein IKL97_02455 [Eggerthellaceae bacterium]|nr:hypothetical protein [Eggerthellaceae bacterium]